MAAEPQPTPNAAPGQARRDTTLQQLLSLARDGSPVVLTGPDGTPEAAILPWRLYELLIACREAHEDAVDLAIGREAQAEAERDGYVALDDLDAEPDEAERDRPAEREPEVPAAVAG